MDASKKDVFLKELNRYIIRRQKLESLYEHSFTCADTFDDDEMYVQEQELIKIVFESHKRTGKKTGEVTGETTVLISEEEIKKASESKESTKEKGDSLEALMKALFGRVRFIDSIEVTNRDIAIGQIDLQLSILDQKGYEVLGFLPSEIPKGLIGECKNYGIGSKVEREDIEKMCWRSGKAGFLSFYIGRQFTSGALNEIDDFNLHKEDILKKHNGVFIAPISLEMIQLILDEKINFCYFIRWVLDRSKTHNITPHFRGS